MIHCPVLTVDSSRPAGYQGLLRADPPAGAEEESGPTGLHPSAGGQKAPEARPHSPHHPHHPHL